MAGKDYGTQAPAWSSVSAIRRVANATIPTGPNGAAASTHFYQWGRVTSSTSVDGAFTYYTYSAPGALPATQLAVTSGSTTSVAGSGNISVWTQTTLDGVGRAVKVQSGSGSTPTNPSTETDTVYGPCACSPMGKMVQVSQPHVPGVKMFVMYQLFRNKGPLDVKQQGSQYQNFGNFLYGAFGEAFGLPSQVLLRAAGWDQIQAGISTPGWGSTWSGAQYGDDPAQIQSGIQFGSLLPQGVCR